jgi:flagellar basal-body rod modification protein FlgD
MATGLTTSASNHVVDQNTFLQLMIAQMRNQDPTNPMDTAQMMGQFAQMSQVEQAVQTNSKLDALLSSSALSQADGLIGRTVKFISDDGTAVSGKIKSVSINKDGAVANLEDGTAVFVGPGLTLS